MNPFPHKTFKALITIQLVLILLFFLLLLLASITNRKNNTNNDFEVLMYGIFFAFIGVHMGNLLYNFKLLKGYKDEDGSATFSKSLSVVLLILYTLGCMFGIFIIIAALYEAMDINRSPNLLNASFWGMLIFMFILAILSIWIIILQIKLLRLLKRRQLTKADELVAQLGADSESR